MVFELANFERGFEILLVRDVMLVLPGFKALYFDSLSSRCDIEILWVRNAILKFCGFEMECWSYMDSRCGVGIL